MEITGNGFIARNLASIAHVHPGVVAFAAGVPSSAMSGEPELAREASLLYDHTQRCLREGRKLVFFSTASAAMYGAENSPGTEDGPVFPTGAYGRHNLALETVLAQSGADYLVIRVSTLVGPFQRSYGVVPTLVRGVRSGRVTLYRGTRRDLIDIADMVAILDALLTRDVSREIVNVACGFAIPVEQIVGHIEGILGTAAERNVIDEPIPHGSASVSITKLRRLVPDIDRFGLGPAYYQRVLDSYVRLYDLYDRDSTPRDASAPRTPTTVAGGGSRRISS